MTSQPTNVIDITSRMAGPASTTSAGPCPTCRLTDLAAELRDVLAGGQLLIPVDTLDHALTEVDNALTSMRGRR